MFLVHPVKSACGLPLADMLRDLDILTPIAVGNVLTFTKSSNPTLDGIIEEMQHKIILPSYLPVPQRKKIFRSRWKLKLEQNPIEIEVDNKKIRFRHINSAGGEVPNATKLLYRAMDNMQTKDDWQKLPKLLEGLWANANCRFEHTDWPKIIRRAALSGNLGPIFEALKNPKKTGLKLDSSEKVQRVMSALVWEAADAGWTPPATERALRNAEKVIAFLEQEAHQLRGQAKEIWEKRGRFPLKRDPQVLMTPLLLAAMLVARHGKGAEYGDKMRKYAQVVLEKWPAGKGLLELHPHESYIDPEGMAYVMEKNKFLEVAAPILRGFDLAIEGLGRHGLAQEMKSRRDAVAEEVQAALAADETKGRRMGAVMYEKCFAEPQVPKSKAEPKGEAKAKA